MRWQWEEKEYRSIYKGKRNLRENSNDCNGTRKGRYRKRKHDNEPKEGRKVVKWIYSEN